VNQTRKIVVPAVRGMIADDTGQALVTNQTSMTVSVNMMQLSQTTKDDGKAVLTRLAPLLHTPEKTLAEKVRLCTRGVPQPCWTGSPYQPIPVAEHVSDTIALQIMEEPTLFPGVVAKLTPVVDYPMPAGANPAQVLGYLQPITQAEMAKQHIPETGFAGDDLVGQSGLEAQYNTALTGKPGTELVSVNAAGDVLGTVGGTPAKTGDTLVTSLNGGVQEIAQQALNSAIARSRAAGNAANQGAAIVETTTGRIVAMASYPDYNPSVWANGISQSEFKYLFGTASGEPVMNWATQGEYAPGSTFKITSTAAAVADGFPLNGSYACPASVNIGGHTFYNDGQPSLGSMSFATALIQSCDTVYYNLGYQMCRPTTTRPTTCSARTRPPRRCSRWSSTGASARPPASTCRNSPPARSRPASGSTGCGKTTRTRARTGARTARPTAPTSSRSSTRTASTAGSGSPARRRSRRSARAT
jgi:penicillin-binding protein 2